ncbi:uncharacterized protein LOC144101382 [Amblyomma americanum]
MSVPYFHHCRQIYGPYSISCPFSAVHLSSIQSSVSGHSDIYPRLSRVGGNAANTAVYTWQYSCISSQKAGRETTGFQPPAGRKNTFVDLTAPCGSLLSSGQSVVMGLVVCLVLAVFGAASLAEAKLGPPGGPGKLHRDVVDSFWAMAHFPYSVAISDSNNDTIFECVAANRTEIDPVARTGTFVWLFPETEDSPKLEVPFYLTADGPGTITFTIDDDPTVREGKFYYSDEQCVVLDMEFNGHQCLLWTLRKLKDSVPQVCIDQFKDACGVVVNQHSRDLCPDGEGDY